MTVPLDDDDKAKIVADLAAQIEQALRDVAELTRIRRQRPLRADEVGVLADSAFVLAQCLLAAGEPPDPPEVQRYAIVWEPAPDQPDGPAHTTVVEYLTGTDEDATTRIEELTFAQERRGRFVARPMAQPMGSGA